MAARAWTHGHKSPHDWSDGDERAACRTAKAVCTFRDPRDCVASDLVFMGGGLEQTILRVNGSLEFLKHYQNTPHILLVRYEDMMTDRFSQIRRIAEHLNVTLDEQAIARIDAKTNLESSQKLCKELNHRPSNQVLTIQSHRVDPDTHLHENHIETPVSVDGRTKCPQSRAAG